MVLASLGEIETSAVYTRSVGRESAAVIVTSNTALLDRPRHFAPIDWVRHIRHYDKEAE